jgi:hypothetical protein
MEIVQENSLIQIVETSGLEKSKGANITESLSKFFDKASEWNNTIESIVITDPSETGKMKMAKEGRLFLKNLRLEGLKIVELKRGEIKARMADDVLEDKLWLKAGQMMEATFKNLETKLEDKEKFAERWEADRKQKLMQERITLLNPYQEFVPFGIETSLGEMEASEFDKLLNGAKLQLEAKKEAERKAEEERILFEKKQAEEREKIRLENERLKKEAEEKEKQLAEERKKAEAEKKAIEEKARKEREAAEKEAAKLRAEQEAKLKKEREEKEKLEMELQAKKDAEEKAKQEEQAKAEAELAKGDSEKLADLLSSLEMLKYKHQFKSKKYQKVQSGVNELLEKIIVFAKQKAQ